MSTLGELYKNAKAALSAAEIDTAETDALLLMGHFFSASRAEIITHPEKKVSEQSEKSFLAAVKKRGEHYPLQYILGSWEFMGLELQTGEGVLCPREDTATLVYALAKKLSDAPAVGVDLCAGTGAVSLGLCSLLPSVSVHALELFEDAYKYLELNLDTYAELDIQPHRADVLNKQDIEKLGLPPLDFIASNPPYIESADISHLQEEVQHEPSSALDGGTDGLDFYRAILSPLWSNKLKHGGVIGVEIGETQAEAVSSLMAAAGFSDIEVHKDMAGLDRAVTARKI